MRTAPDPRTDAAASGAPDRPVTAAVADWVTAFAGEVGLPTPDDATIATILELAGVAAHASARQAAPIACWLVGVAGLSPAEAVRAARAVDAVPTLGSHLTQ